MSHSFFKWGNLVFPLAISFMLFGCNNLNYISKSKFEEAINKYFEKHQECVEVGVLPKVINVNDVYNNLYYDIYKKMELFSKMGLLSVMLENSKGGDAKVRKYMLTEEGKKYVSQSKENERVKFCYAKKIVTEIKKYNNPIDNMGVVTAKVNFKYKFINVAPWIKNANFLAAYPNVSEIAQGEKEETVELTKTNEGWR